MKILYARGMWGMEKPTLAANLETIKEGGFDIVEMGAPVEPSVRKELAGLLKKLGLGLIAQQWTVGSTPEEHAKSFEEQYRRGAELSPLFINSHTGKDYYTLEQNLVVFRAAKKLEQELGVRVTHETHRGRALYTAPAAVALLGALPELRFTADFSHWCCVHESLLEDQQPAVEKAIQASSHIHARVGHAEGPQISHPGAPEWKDALEAHLAWWKRIVAANEKRGEAVLTITPEFGPVPYMHTLPYTNQPVADLWEVNFFMKGFLLERLGSGRK
jgi:sugar phosphate isomerase/epimerase